MNVMHFDINSNPESVDKFCEKVTELISENSQTTKEDSSYCMIDTISAQSIDVEHSCVLGYNIQPRRKRSKGTIHS